MPVRKKKIPIDKNAFTLVEKTFYELSIEDLRKKIDRMSALNDELDQEYNQNTEILRGLDEDDKDEAAKLKNILRIRNEEFREVDYRLEQMLTLRADENAEAEKTIKTLEEKFKAMHDQFNATIKKKNGELNALSEFRGYYYEVLEKLATEEEYMNEDMEAREIQIVALQSEFDSEKREMFQKIEQQLLETSATFYKKLAIRNSGFVHRLTRENVTMQRQVDVLAMSQIKTNSDLVEQKKNFQRMKGRIGSRYQLQTNLIKTCERKVLLIAAMVDAYENLKKLYLNDRAKCRNTDDVSFHEQCKVYEHDIQLEELKELKHCRRTLKVEVNHLWKENEHLEAEILRLRKILEKLKVTVMAELEIGSIDGAEWEKLQASSFINVIYDLINSIDLVRYESASMERSLSDSSAIERPSVTVSMMNTFFEPIATKRKRDILIHENLIPHDPMYYPEEQSTADLELVDVKWGMLFYASDEDEEEVAPVQEEEVEEELVSSSDDDAPPQNQGSDIMQQPAEATKVEPDQQIQPMQEETKQVKVPAPEEQTEEEPLEEEQVEQQDDDAESAAD